LIGNGLKKGGKGFLTKLIARGKINLLVEEKSTEGILMRGKRNLE